ncbi:MAG: hypothetical protein AAFQ45_04165 [Pseudomonadota bacterium]
MFLPIEKRHPVYEDVRATADGGAIRVSMRPKRGRIYSTAALDLLMVALFAPGFLSAVLLLGSGNARGPFEGLSGPFSTVLIENAEAILFALVIFQGLMLALYLPSAVKCFARSFSRTDVSIANGRVHVRDHVLFDTREWRLPLSEFIGVRRRCEQLPWSELTVIELAHRNPEQTVVLYAAPVVAPSVWEAFATKLGRPMLDQDARGTRTVATAVQPRLVPADADAALASLIARAPADVTLAQHENQLSVSYFCRRPQQELSRVIFPAMGVVIACCFATIAFAFDGPERYVPLVPEVAAVGDAGFVEKLWGLLTSWKVVLFAPVLVAMCVPLAFVTRRELVFDSEGVRISGALGSSLWPAHLTDRLCFSEINSVAVTDRFAIHRQDLIERFGLDPDEAPDQSMLAVTAVSDTQRMELAFGLDPMATAWLADLVRTHAAIATR